MIELSNCGSFRSHTNNQNSKRVGGDGGVPLFTDIWFLNLNVMNNQPVLKRFK